MKVYDSLKLIFENQEEIVFPMESVSKLLLNDVRTDIVIEKGFKRETKFASNVIVEVEGTSNLTSAYVKTTGDTEPLEKPFERVCRFADIVALSLIGPEGNDRYEVEWRTDINEYGYPNNLQHSEIVDQDLVLFVGKDDEYIRHYQASLFLKERL